ncbi:MULTISPECIES: ABC transporter permease [unclassified Pseudactinotalea]|uniref:ABC transporter permease n=1 Tax=Micrococcales TaxID=85006 RepID=UPI003C7B5E62
MTWVLDNLDLIGGLTVEHLRQSAVPIVLGLALSIPLGWVAYRYRLTQGLVLTLVGLLYTIPSLALFAILPPLLGISFLSEVNLIIALTIYAVAIMTRFVADALVSVEPSVRQAATAVGYGPWQRFWQVELPLAGPVVLAGLRVTAVSTISLATVGILIGIDNLGYLFTNGYQRQIVASVLAGVVATVVIALLIDALLQLAGRFLMPWTALTSAKRATT